MHSPCVAFDVDDTLYLERDYVRSGFEAVGAWAEQWLGVPQFAESAWQLFLGGRRGDIFDEALRQTGIDPRPGLIQTLLTLYRSHRPRISLLPDASRCLARLKDRAALAIVTDGPAIAQTLKAEALGLEELAAPLVLTDLWGPEFSKPHLRGFEAVQSHHASRGVRFVYVGDNPAKDFTGPRQLGWLTVRVRRPGGLHYALECSDGARPDLEVRDLSDLGGLLAARLGS